MLQKGPITSFLTLLLIILLIFTGEGRGEDNDYGFTSSNPEFGPVIQYDLPTNFYQDHRLLIGLKELDDPSLEIHYEVSNGRILALDEYDLDRLSEEPNWEVYSGEGLKKGEFPLMIYGDDEAAGYALAPDYLDRDFELLLNISVMKGTVEVYWERHVFQIIGEPIVFEGTDPFEELEITEQLLYFFGVSLALWVTIALLVIITRKITRRDRK